MDSHRERKKEENIQKGNELSLQLSLTALPTKGPVWVVCGHYCPMAALAHVPRQDALIQDLFAHRLIPSSGILPCPLLQPEGFLHRLGELAGRQEVQDALSLPSVSSLF